MNLKCLTVCQPYAWLIGVGFKPCENRPYPILRPLQGQDLAIHAGLSDAWFTDDAWGLVRHACSRLNLPAMTPRDFPRGVVTCVVRVSAVVRVDVALRHFHRLIREGAPHAGDHLMHVGGPWVALLDQVPFFHHRDFLCEMSDQRQVMGDEQHGHACAHLQASEQFQHLPAKAGVQCRGGFVGQQQFGLAGQGHGHHGPLALSARELVGVAVCPALRLIHAGVLQQLKHAWPGVLFGKPLFEFQYFGNLLANGQQRVERGHRLLEDHGDFITAYGPQLALRPVQ